MADPKKLKILKLLTMYLEQQVTGWTGEKDDGSDWVLAFDLAGRIHRGKVKLTVDDAENAMSILESPRPIEGLGVGEEKRIRYGPWNLLIQGFPRDDKQHPSDMAYYMAAATQQALGKLIAVDSQGDREFPELWAVFDPYIATLTIGEAVVRPPEGEVSRLAMFYLPLTLGIVTDARNPSA